MDVCVKEPCLSPSILHSFVCARPSTKQRHLSSLLVTHWDIHTEVKRRTKRGCSISIGNNSCFLRQRS